MMDKPTEVMLTSLLRQIDQRVADWKRRRSVSHLDLMIGTLGVWRRAVRTMGLDGGDAQPVGSVEDQTRAVIAAYNMTVSLLTAVDAVHGDKRDLPLCSPPLLLKLHAALMERELVERWCGAIRKDRMMIINPITNAPLFEAPAPQDLYAALGRIETTPDRAETGFALDHPVVRAARLHRRLTLVHPFVDGNGRTARMIALIALMREGFPMLPLETIVEENRGGYNLSLLESWQNGDDTSFVVWFVMAVERSLARLWFMAPRLENLMRSINLAMAVEGTTFMDRHKLATTLVCQPISTMMSLRCRMRDHLDDADLKACLSKLIEAGHMVDVALGNVRMLQVPAAIRLLTDRSKLTS